MTPRLVGNNHINLTVSDLERSTEWYCRVFELTVVSNDKNTGPPYFTDVAYNGLFDLRTFSYIVGLIQHRVPLAEPFDARRVGLDHFGLQVPEAADLLIWVKHLESQSVAHSGVIHAPYADVINFNDPDGIALELSWTNLDFWMPLVAEVTEVTQTA